MQVLEVIAAVKGLDVDELASVIYQNTLDVFFPSGGKGAEETPRIQLCDEAKSEVNEWKQWLLVQRHL